MPLTPSTSLGSTLEVYCVAHRKPPTSLPQGLLELGVGSFQEAQFFTGIGNHINEKNPRYSELTAIYWLLNNPVVVEEGSRGHIGICHYRRFFGSTALTGLLPQKNSRLLSVEDFIAASEQFNVSTVCEGLQRDDGFVPEPMSLGRSLRQFYAEKHLGAEQDIELAYNRAAEKGLFDRDFASHQLGHETRLLPFCMSILPGEIFKRIWSQILDTLLEIEPDISAPLDPYQARNMGFLGERLHSSALLYLVKTKQIKPIVRPVFQVVS